MADEELKLYFDYKSPFAYLAMEPALALPARYAVALRPLPFLLRIKGKGERSVYSEWQVRRSYLDAAGEPAGRGA
jgi:2-hydroxychromene-2-carboxylate isomerase